MSVPRGKGKAIGDLNDKKAIRLAKYEKSGDQKDLNGNPFPRWGEFIIGYFSTDEKYAFYKVKEGTQDSPHGNRELHNSSQRRRGSSGKFLQEDDAREYVENTDWDKGGIDNFEQLLEIREEIKEIEI